MIVEITLTYEGNSQNTLTSTFEDIYMWGNRIALVNTFKANSKDTLINVGLIYLAHYRCEKISIKKDRVIYYFNLNNIQSIVKVK